MESQQFEEIRDVIGALIMNGSAPRASGGASCSLFQEAEQFANKRQEEERLQGEFLEGFEEGSSAEAALMSLCICTRTPYNSSPVVLGARLKHIIASVQRLVNFLSHQKEDASRLAHS